MYRRQECCQCLRYGLTRAVGICPGVVEVHRIWLCLDCRVGWRDDQYACLAETLKFNSVARAKWRAARVQT